jgi:tetratricopeptide (TPR) repeat protein
MEGEYMRQPSALLRRFPRSDETWQIGRFRLPIWIEEEGRAPFRPSLAVCARLPSGLVFTSALQEEGIEPSAVCEVLLEAVEAWGLLPGRVQVSEDDLADNLKERLAVREIPVELCNGLPLLDRAMSELGKELYEPPPGPLAGEGVTVEQMASFAEAAALFATAEPWRHLAGDDPIHVETPDVPPEVRYLSLMGHAGQQHGILFQREAGFFQEEDDEHLREKALEEGFWTVSFDPASEVPPEDHDLWERHRLPLAHERAFPVAAHFGGPDGIGRPDARLLDIFEGLLRALASTTEDEMDEGRWTKEVVTHLGRATFVLSLPFLLDPPRLETEIPVLGELQMEQVLQEIERRMASGGPGSIVEASAIVRQVMEEGEARRPSLGPREEARELASEAMRAHGRRRVALARRALKLWPDCADAYVVLADRESDPVRARELLALAVAAGERALGPELFQESAGHFWGLFRTRPYMRARCRLAEVLWHGGRREEAVEHFRELLRLNPVDNQGIRYHLAHAFLVLRRHDELASLLESYPEEASAEWAYARVLLAFRRQGDSPGSRACLTLALRQNRFVPPLLLTWKKVPPVPPLFMEPGSEWEAMSYASSFGEAWEDTPGALGWLLERAPLRTTRKKKDKKKARGGRKGRR